MQLADGVRTWPEEREKNLNVQILLLKQVQYVPFIEEISVNSPEQQEGKSSHKGSHLIMCETRHSFSVISLTYQDGQEGSPSNPVGFNDQDYAQLRDTCLHTGSLFVDSTFPPNSQSLGDLPDLSSWREAQVEWLRPQEILKLQNITDEAVFILDGASRFDFSQGAVGNCWFLAAISALTFHKSVLGQVVPTEQSFENYAGIFHFRFWRFGEWVDVVVDDYLPVLDGTLLSVRSKGGIEFWVALLEKAYAKVCGSYADMNAGLPSEACKDFCGGINMIYELKDAHTAGHDDKLWLTLERATTSHAMICCGTAWKGDMLLNTVSRTGLVDGHAYTITGVTKVNCFGCDVKLVRLMNPWGKQEWSGKWSDKSSEWNRVSAEDQKKRNKREDGEFWMDLEDFCYYFQMLFICGENPSFIDRDVDCRWKYQIYQGSWVAGKSSGGDLNDYTFDQNPQYRIQVAEEVEAEKGERNVLFSLMQKPQRSRRSQSRFLPIGLSIFKVPPGTPEGHLEGVFFKNNKTVKDGQMYYYEREMTEFYSLEPGEYVVVPSTMRAYMNADFVLTVYFKFDTDLSPHDEDGHHNHTPVSPTIPTDKEEEPMEKDATILFERYARQDKLNARQLQKLLNENFPRGTWHNFSLDSCRSLIALMDKTRKMKMNISEFSALWEKIDKFKNLFQSSDTNRNRYLNKYELKKALSAAAMELSDETVDLLMYRYSDSAIMPYLSLNGFIPFMMRMDRMLNVFNENSGKHMHLSFEEWSHVFMYN
uniref:Calpain catalytic domain-containing protein n=1 Tax=Takifugu rubripes TaxID=31033 RepID=H2RJM9_TAKRU